MIFFEQNKSRGKFKMSKKMDENEKKVKKLLKDGEYDKASEKIIKLSKEKQTEYFDVLVQLRLKAAEKEEVAD